MIPGGERIVDLDQAWREPRHGPQLRAVRRAAEQVRERFAAGPRCVAVRTLPLGALPYPTGHAFSAAASAPSPLVIITLRCVLVQFFQGGELKNLLFEPTDLDGARTTPFFARILDQLGRRLGDRLARRFAPLEEQLAELGLQPRDIDYVAYDHFHAQDLRGLLGTEDGSRAARFPNATLVAARGEWEAWDDLHPLQRAWFVRDGKRDVSTSDVVLTDSDIALGAGVMLLRTPGHTPGHQTLFVNTASGIWGVSGNGTCADSWSPLDSRIHGLSSFCRQQEIDVILDANTPEHGAAHYTSMVLERTLVDRVARAPAFVQVLPSSEVTPSLLAPGLSPTLLHRAITHGEIARPTPRPTQPHLQGNP